MSWTCPKCERELVKENQTHYCAKVSLDSLFEGKAPGLILVFDKLLAEIADWENVTISTSPNCIVFGHHKVFFVIRPMKKELDIQFYSQSIWEEYPVIKSLLYGGKYENHIRISSVDDITPQLFSYIHTSYLLH